MLQNLKQKFFQKINPAPKIKKITLKNPIKKICPFQRFIDQRPYPYRKFIRSSSDLNYFNHPIKQDQYVSCFKNIFDRKLRPLVSREDLAKFLHNRSNTLFKHLKPCNSCSEINNSNYNKNYYINFKKCLPIIRKRESKENINDLKISECCKEENSTNLSRNIPIIKKKIHSDICERSKNFEIKKIDTKKEKNLNLEKQLNNKFNSTSFCYIPRNKRGFHKTQIFNGSKPFLVDDFILFE